MKAMIGVCGENCKYCPRFIATKSGNVEELKKVKNLWVRLGLRDLDFSFERMVCYGCKPENNCAYPKLKACVTRKHLNNCASCEQYPCDTINEVYEKTEKFRRQAIIVCSKEEMKMLEMAFFYKKINIDDLRRKYLR